MTKLRGIVPPVVVPLNADYSLDLGGYRALLERLIDGGVDALFVLGSSSEVVFHDAAKRARILETSMEVAGDRVPVICGVIDPTTDRVIGHIKQAQSFGIKGVVATAPFYIRTNQDETRDHFRYLREACDVPLYAYDLPVCVHIKLTNETIVTLAREDVIAGVKDSSGDDAGLATLVKMMEAEGQVARAAFSILTGSELTVDQALRNGTDGAVPGLCNVDPRGYVRLWQAAENHDWEKAADEQSKLHILFEIALLAGRRLSGGAAGVGGFKTALREMGVIGSNVMSRPHPPLDAAEAAEVRQVLVRAGLK